MEATERYTGTTANLSIKSGIKRRRVDADALSTRAIRQEEQRKTAEGNRASLRLMKTPSSLPPCTRETGKRKWSGTKDTCPECVCDADIGFSLIPRRGQTERERGREQEFHPSNETRQLVRNEGKGRTISVVSSSTPSNPFSTFCSRSSKAELEVRRMEPEGESDQPSIPAFDASHYGNAISRASLENYVDVMPHLLAPLPPPSYRHPYPLFLPNLLAPDSSWRTGERDRPIIPPAIIPLEFIKYNYLSQNWVSLRPFLVPIPLSLRFSSPFHDFRSGSLSYQKPLDGKQDSTRAMWTRRHRFSTILAYGSQVTLHRFSSVILALLESTS